MSAPDRRALLDRDQGGVLSIRLPCKLLSIARLDVYRAPIPANDDDLALMRRRPAVPAPDRVRRPRDRHPC